MNPHLPTDNDLRLLQELLNTKIRTGEQVRRDISQMVEEATRRAVLPVDQRISEAESTLASTKESSREVRVIVDSAVDQIGGLRGQLKEVKATVIEHEVTLCKAREKILALQSDIGVVDRRVVTHASDLDQHAKNLVEIQAAIRGAVKSIAGIELRLDQFSGQFDQRIEAAKSLAASAVQALTSEVTQVRSNNAAALDRVMGFAVEKVSEQAARITEVERHAEAHLLAQLEALKKNRSEDIAQLLRDIDGRLESVTALQVDADQRHELARVNAEKRQTSNMSVQASLLRKSSMHRDAVVLVIAIAALVMATLAWL